MKARKYKIDNSTGNEVIVINRWRYDGLFGIFNSEEEANKAISESNWHGWAEFRIINRPCRFGRFQVVTRNRNSD